MAHTNMTSNYNLPQFISSDKPAWLTDVNTAYYDIDAQMKLNADAAANADAKAVTALNTANTAQSTADSAKDFMPGETFTIHGIFAGVSTSGGGAIQFTIPMPKRLRNSIASWSLTSYTIDWIHGDGNAYAASTATLGTPASNFVTLTINPSTNVPGNRCYGVSITATITFSAPNP